MKMKIKVPKVLLTFMKSIFSDTAKEIAKGMLIGVGIALFGLIKGPINNFFDTNNAINKISIGESKEYINTLIGIPQYEIEDSGLINALYDYNNVIFRVVFDKNMCVAYFITVRDKYNLLDFKNFNAKLGKGTYTDNFDMDPYNLEASITNGTDAFVYYWEKFYNGSSTLYNDWVLGYLPYGFDDENSNDLLLKTWEYERSENETVKEEQVHEYRIKAKPNTIGCILTKYKDTINPVIENDEWITWVSNVESN